MPHRSQLADIVSNTSKVVTSMSRTKNAMVPQKSSKMRNLGNCLVLIHVRNLKDYLEHWMLIDPPLGNAYMRWRWFRRQENGILDVLKETDIERALVTCDMLLQPQERKRFLQRIVTGDGKWIHYNFKLEVICICNL
ncbi:hypothetical protein Trydic_g23317 [Trypoxylus dichotomus]